MCARQVQSTAVHRNHRCRHHLPSPVVLIVIVRSEESSQIVDRRCVVSMASMAGGGTGEMETVSVIGAQYL